MLEQITAPIRRSEAMILKDLAGVVALGVMLVAALHF